MGTQSSQQTSTMPPEFPSKTATSRALLIYLLVTALLCGGLIMVIEVLGSRVIGPFFGVSLFIWTSLIAVTMISLALGYGLGGLFSDRYGSPAFLYAIVTLAGLLVTLIPLVRAAVLEFSIPLGLRLGSFVSSSLLFGPSLFLLGCVSPYLIRVASVQSEHLGKTVGGFYALSTVGSVIGTAATGFYLIAYLSVDNILYLVGGLLITLGAGYFALFRHQYLACLALLIPVILALQPASQSLTRVAADGTKVTLVATVPSYYGSIQVVDYSFGDKRLRELTIDGLVQGGVDPDTHLSVYEYAYLLQFLPYALNPDGKRCLTIGLGAGVVPRWYEEQGITTDVVDIDPDIFLVAKNYFNLDLRGTGYVQDARFFLLNSTNQYDYLILDVFSGDTTPSHLLSLEALQLTARQLTADGVLAINMVGDIGANSYMTASVTKTLEAVFDEVLIYPLFDRSAKEQSGNLVVLAYQGAPRLPDLAGLTGFSVHPMARRLVTNSIEQPFRFPADTRSMVLTDNYNPIDFFDADLRESVRRRILQTTDFEVLLRSGRG